MFLPQQIVYGADVLVPNLFRILKRLFSYGVFPSKWAEFIIIPIYQKGSNNQPNNYRGTTLIDIINKILTAIVTKRVTFDVNIYDTISECQACFRSGYSTIDNAFVLYSIVSKYLIICGVY